MRAHELFEDGYHEEKQPRWGQDRAKIDIIGLGHLILAGTVPVGKNAVSSIKSLSSVGITFADLHTRLEEFYKEKEDSEADCIPIIKKWLLTHKPHIAQELHSEHWETTPKSSSMMSSKQTQHPPTATS